MTRLLRRRRCELHDQFESKLDLSRAVALPADHAEVAGVDLAARSAKTHAVEGVEELDPELGVPLTLIEVVVLEQRQIEALVTVLAQVGHHARRVAEGEGRR